METVETTLPIGANWSPVSKVAFAIKRQEIPVVFDEARALDDAKRAAGASTDRELVWESWASAQWNSACTA